MTWQFGVESRKASWNDGPHLPTEIAPAPDRLLDLRRQLSWL
jgi:hypothetical protein